MMAPTGKEDVMKAWIGAALVWALVAPGMAAAQEQQHTIIMSGHGEVHGQPDTAMLVRRGQCRCARRGGGARRPQQQDMQAVMAALKKLGVADKDIQTRNFSVHPQYANGNGEAPRVTGYQVSNQVEVRLRGYRQAGPGAGRAGDGRRQPDQWREFFHPRFRNASGTGSHRRGG